MLWTNVELTVMCHALDLMEEKILNRIDDYRPEEISAVASLEQRVKDELGRRGLL